MKRTPTSVLLALSAAAAAFIPQPALAQVPGFATCAGWPIEIPSGSVDGGMLVNMDGDAELELVQVVDSTVQAFNADATPVPGWPQSVDYGTFAAPAFGDLDGDDQEEVVVSTFYYGISGSVWAFHQDGTVLSGFPVSGIGTLKGPALGDVDGDGDLEIIVVGNVSGVGHVYVLDHDGLALPGWPQVLGEIAGAGAAVGDVDGDGIVEIFACSFYALYGFHPDGSLLPGFPFVPGSTFNYNTPALADLDQDGDREIVTATSEEFTSHGRVYVLEHDGSVVPGWPQDTAYNIFTPPSVADIDGDGWLDIAIGDQVLAPKPVNYLYAWDRAGNELPGFPVRRLNAIYAQIIVADIDGDGAVELMFDDNVADSDLMACNHDGSTVDGWPLPLEGSSFQQSPSVADIDGDGFIDLAASGNDIANNRTFLYLLESSSIAWDPALAPVPTYQYNVRRDGMVPGDEAPCLGDLDGDGERDLADLAQLLANYGATGGMTHEDGDLDGDGDVDLSDLAELLAVYGISCP
jgi:hypothetical protein